MLPRPGKTGVASGRRGKLFWLVVDLPLWKICKSVGMMTFPIYGNIKKCSRPPTSHGWKNVWMDVIGMCWSSLFLENIRFAIQLRADFLFLKPLHCDMPSIHTAPFWRNHEILKPKSTHSYLPSPSLPVLPKAKPRRGEVNNTSTDLGFGLTKNPPHMRTPSIIKFLWCRKWLMVILWWFWSDFDVCMLPLTA